MDSNSFRMPQNAETCVKKTVFPNSHGHFWGGVFPNIEIHSHINPRFPGYRQISVEMVGTSATTFCKDPYGDPGLISQG